MHAESQATAAGETSSIGRLVPQQRPELAAGPRGAEPHRRPADHTTPPSPARRPGTVSVIIPTLNEAENIAWALARLPEGLHEVVLVDGRSTDGTIEVAQRERPDIRVVHETRRGKGAALRAGFAAATGDYIVMIDADGSMHPEEIPLYVAYLDAGFDFVKGSRFMLAGGSDDMTVVRRVGHWPLLSFVRWTFRVRFTDLCYGFVAFRRSCLPYLQLTADGFEIESELILRAVRARLRIAEVPSWELPRMNGESNLNAVRDGLRILRVLMRERFAGRTCPVATYEPREEQARVVIDLVDHSEPWAVAQRERSTTPAAESA
jgi:hypothetical protein